MKKVVVVVLEQQQLECEEEQKIQQKEEKRGESSGQQNKVEESREAQTRGEDGLNLKYLTFLHTQSHTPPLLSLLHVSPYLFAFNSIQQYQLHLPNITTYHIQFFNEQDMQIKSYSILYYPSKQTQFKMEFKNLPFITSKNIYLIFLSWGDTSSVISIYIKKVLQENIHQNM